MPLINLHFFLGAAGSVFFFTAFLDSPIITFVWAVLPVNGKSMPRVMVRLTLINWRCLGRRINSTSVSCFSTRDKTGFALYCLILSLFFVLWNGFASLSLCSKFPWPTFGVCHHDDHHWQAHCHRKKDWGPCCYYKYLLLWLPLA